MKKIWELVKKYKSFIFYMIFGVLTTVVNIIAYWLLAHILNLGTVVSTVGAWILAVAFAYITNRIWVFESEAHEKKSIIKEIISFVSCRLFTGLLDIVIMYVFVDKLSFNDMIIKIISNIVVIILNYVFSKLIIFKKNK